MQLAEFREYARSFNVVPVSRKLLADGETPLAVYRKLGANRPALFYLNQPNMAARGHVIHLLA
jgi:anthranilate synthase component 1